MPAEQVTPGLAIAYVIGTYPTLTTTFIDREIKAVRQRGIDLQVVSIRRPLPNEEAPEPAEIVGRIRYLLPARWDKIGRTSWRWMFIRPGQMLTLLLYLLTRPHPSFSTRLKTLFHFIEGVLAADHLRDKGIRHIHTHFADRAAVVALVAARLLGISYSVFAHANDIYVDPVLLPEKIKHASFVATCTAYNRAHLNALCSQSIELIYHGLDLADFCPPQRRSTRLLRILAVGQLREKKGHAHLIRACRELRNRGYEFICDIIGDGPQRQTLQALIESLQLPEMVHLRGALRHSQVLTYYEKANVFALGSVEAGNADRDGIPNVFLEAMAMRVPVVGSRLSGIPELIQDSVNGLLVAPGDANALAEAIARLWDDPALAERLVAEGKATVEQYFNIEQNVGRLVGLFQQAIGCRAN